MSAAPARQVLSVERNRFAAGFDLVETQEHGPAAATDVGPSVVIDLIRPVDLLALRVEAVGCELLSGDDPVLRPVAGNDQAHLVVRYSFQHMAEVAAYEGGSVPKVDPDNPDEPTSQTESAEPRPQPPVGARAANGSRLVFAVPPGETIAFSTEGILAAISRLDPMVHDLAEPGAAPTGQSRLARGLIGDVRLIALPGGLVGALAGTSLYAREANTKELRELGVPPRRDRASSAQSTASASRRARRFLVGRSAQLDREADAPKIFDQGTVSATIGGQAVDVPSLFGSGGLVGEHLERTRVTRRYSYPPSDAETAIEAPYRLIISPSEEGRWKHSLQPVRATSDTRNVELWHSRLGQAASKGDGSKVIDEKVAGRRIVRAIWARDRDGVPASVWRAPGFLRNAADYPFRMSLSPLDRHMLVRQTSETIPGSRRRSIPPVPLAAEALWLSSLGSWLKLHGSWNTLPYSQAGFPSILFMDYNAPLGRDQHVEVAYPGYLHPFGHSATLVKVTDRKMKEAAPSLAALYQRKFLVIGESRRVYSSLEFPFSQVEIRPLVTPTLDDPGPGVPQLFWPRIKGQPLNFEIRTLDQEGRSVKFSMPLMWVAEDNSSFADVECCYANGLNWGETTAGKPNRTGDPWRVVPVHGQMIAYTPSQAAELATLPTATMRFLGKAMLGTSIPRMSSADVLIPAVQQLSPRPPIPIVYHPLYRKKGFASPDNLAELWAAVVTESVTAEATFDPYIPLPEMRFGDGGAATEKTGGFLAPSVPIRGLSRLTGVAGATDAAAAKLQFNPKAYFGGSSPKLFGLIDLSDLAVSFDSDLLKIPKIMSEFVTKVGALVDDIGSASKKLADAAAEARRVVAQAENKPAEWIQQINHAIDKADELEAAFEGFKDRLGDAFDLITSQGQSPAENIVKTLKGEIEAKTQELDELAAKLPLVVGNILRALATLLRTALSGMINLAEEMYKYVNGLAEGGTLARVQFEWKPELRSWPAGANPPLIEVNKDSLMFAVGAQAGMNGKNEAYAVAQLVDFKLHLFPSAELIELQFDRFGFRSGGGKPEVDIVFRDIRFHGVLKFVETIRELIPLDGFSDPPDIDVTQDGLKAGFGLALPDIAMGMFSITNMSLNADVQVPFLGKAVTVGFSFCTRERPFTVAVAFIGGGGWVGIRLSAEGLEVLEVGLEAGACIAVDFGVASGSVSAMLGIYIRLESEAGSLAAYFRLRGEVDVLGLISAAIELYMALVYHFDSGKLVGEAKITVNVSVLGISKEVSIYAQRTFKGANADPSFLDVMLEKDGSSPAWDEYCQAFAED